jgi:hypothetical protein
MPPEQDKISWPRSSATYSIETEAMPESSARAQSRLASPPRGALGTVTGALGTVTGATDVGLRPRASDDVDTERMRMSRPHPREGQAAPEHDILAGWRSV